MQELWVQSLGKEDPLEEETASQSSILAWKSHGQSSLTVHGVTNFGHDLVTKQQQQYSMELKTLV